MSEIRTGGRILAVREIAEMVIRILPQPVPITELPRAGPMPHNGYRAFDIAACHAAFPDFSFVPLPRGLMKAMQDSQGPAKGQ